MLKIEQVSKFFNPNTADEKLALTHIHLHLNQGDFVTIIGSNGAGKSTLMNIISGVILPDIGNVIIDDRDVTSMPEHRRSRWIGRVFQNGRYGACDDDRGELGYRRSTHRKAWTRPRSEPSSPYVVQGTAGQLRLGLEDRLSAKVGLLSGGERQALSLLMATFTNPSILLLDEHTAALDPARAELITRLTEEIVRRSSLTTLMVTHNMEQAIRFGNRLIMMDKGRIVLDIAAADKGSLTVEELLREFERVLGEQFVDDRVVLGG
ncbi:ATP-binding cassette domain-containing protein [Paenibacillus sp. MER TA 81-3]|uniref:ABC transporter ATP-binding protein n=1 Tax=Paenibacillus sp. MER TA 81-3 TaxID=2939573 RepID=UPI00203D39F3|nr:ATP-binding cassette domain-containing protein [Paenibacillus sp. MER TA 81-3]MCM3339538.1 ATP-binding cassette domain-containing protein [Paenibacillus sp. MER TA 81-3]